MYEALARHHTHTWPWLARPLSAAAIRVPSHLVNPAATVVHKTGHLVIARDPPRRRLVSTVLWALFGVTLGAVLLSIAVDAVISFALLPSSAQFDTRIAVRMRSAGAEMTALHKNTCIGPERLAVDTIDGQPTGTAAGHRALLRWAVRSERKHLILGVRSGRLHIGQCQLEPTSPRWTAPEAASGMPLYLFGIASFTLDSLKLLLLLGIAALLIRQCRRGPEPTLLAVGFLLLSVNDTMLSSMHVGFAWPPWLIVFSQLGWLATYAGLAGFPDARFTTPLARAVLGGCAAVGLAIVLLTVAGELPFGDLDTRRAVFVAMGAAHVGAVLAAFLRMRATRNLIEHQQLRWAVLGFAIAAAETLLAAGLRRAGLLQVDGRPFIWWVVAIGDLIQFAAGPVGILVALTRFRLFDADAVISRSFVWGILGGVLVAFGAAASKAVQVLGQRFFDPSIGSWAAPMVVTLGLGIAAPAFRWLSQVARRWFQPQLDTLVPRTREALEELRWTGDVTTIAEVVVRRARRAIRAHIGAMVVDGRVVFVEGEAPERMTAWAAALDGCPADEAALAQSTSESMPPLRVPLVGDGVGAVGWLLFGARPDGSLYGRDETKALQAIAQPVAYAVAFVRKRQGWFGEGKGSPPEDLLS